MKYIIIITLAILIYYILTYNKLKKYLIKIEEASSGIDIALTKRYNILTKMVKVVKAYTNYEQEILVKIVKLRKDMSTSEKNNINNQISDNLKKIDIIAESYPELKANENYKILQQSILDVEEHLQASRRMYNSNVSIYNELIATFPTNIVATINGMKKKNYFEASNNEKENIKLEL